MGFTIKTFWLSNLILSFSCSWFSPRTTLEMWERISSFENKKVKVNQRKQVETCHYCVTNYIYEVENVSVNFNKSSHNVYEYMYMYLWNNQLTNSTVSEYWKITKEEKPCNIIN